MMNRHRNVCWRSACLLSGMAVIVNPTTHAQVTHFDGTGDGTNWTDPNNWDNGEPNGATFDAVIDGAAGSPFDVWLIANRTVDTLTIGDGDVLSLANNTYLNPVTQVDNAGTLKVLSTVSTTALQIESDVSLIGGGTIEMSGANARIYDVTLTADGNLTNNDNLIHGRGSIGMNRTTITNHATIRADVDGGILAIDPDADGMTNDGLLEASDGGVLGLKDGTFTNTGGVIRAQTDSAVRFYAGPTIIDGTLDTVGTGIIETGDSTLATLTDVTLDGNLRINNSHAVQLIGTLTNSAGSVLLIDATVSATHLAIESDVTLTGGGTVQMNSGNARIWDAAGDELGHLTNLDNLIHGQGSIGYNRTQLTNHATIRADVSGQLLVLDPGAGGLTNDGLLEADGGGILRLEDGTYNNLGGTIRATDTSSVQFIDGPAITNGTLQTTGSGVIEPGNGTLATLTDVTLDGLLRINDYQNIELIGTFTNQPGSVLQVNAGNYGTDLVIETAVTLTGGGTIEMAGANARILDETGDADTGYLTNQNNLIHGQGRIGYNRMQLTNHDTVRADVDGANLTLDPGINAFVNDGLYEAGGGGILQLGSGAFDNLNGTIRAADASKVQLIDGPAITDGTLQTTGSGVIETGNGTLATLTDVTLDGLLRINDYQNIELIGIFTNQPGSVLRVNAGNYATDLVIETAVTLTGGGTIELAGNNARILDEAGAADTGHLTNQDNLIHGRGRIGYNRMQLTNHATVRADVNGALLILDPGAGGLTNDSLLEANGGGILRLDDGNYHNTGGTIKAQDNSSVQLYDGPAITNGTLQTVGSGVIETGNGTLATLTDVTLDGLLRINDYNKIELAGTFTNLPGSVLRIASNNYGTDLVIESPVTLTGGGTIEMAGNYPRLWDMSGDLLGHLVNQDNLIHGVGNIGGNRTQVTNHGTVRADVSGHNLVIDADARGLTSTGTLAAGNNATLYIVDGFANDGEITTDSNSTVRIDGALTNNAGGTLAGEGLIKVGSAGMLNITNDGEITPGASAGLLTVDVGTLTFGGAGSYTAELGGLVAGDEYDQLLVLGDVTLGGTLNASLIDGYTPAVGDAFDILVAGGAVTGTFDTVNLPAGPGEGFSIHYGPNYVRLTVLRIPGDLNGDGYVGLDDLQLILDHWNQYVTSGEPTLGDISGPNGLPDGYVGLDDLQPVLEYWNYGTPSPTPPVASAGIPEPGVLALLLAGSGWLVGRRS